MSDWYTEPSLIIRTAGGGSESLYGSAWFGSVWGGILGGILGGIARAGFSHRERVLSRTPLIIRAVDQKHDQKRKRRRGGGKSKAKARAIFTPILIHGSNS